MEGRAHTGVVVSFSNSAPGQEAEVEKWYAEVHVKEATATKVFSAATRLESPTAKGDALSPRCATIYEITQPDVVAAWEDHRRIVKELGGMKMHPAYTIVHLGVFMRNPTIPDQVIGPRGPVKKTTGVFLSWSNKKPEYSDAEFMDWLKNYHMPDIIATGLYHTGTHYMNTNAVPGKPQYMTLYETDAPDPIKAQAELANFRHTYRKLDRIPVSPFFISPFKVNFSMVTGKKS